MKVNGLLLQYFEAFETFILNGYGRPNFHRIRTFTFIEKTALIVSY